MKKSFSLTAIISWLLGLTIMTLGGLNLILIHPIPGAVFILLSLLFLPPVENLFKKKLGFTVPFPALIFLALLIFWFTLGVSDLGEMYGF